MPQMCNQRARCTRDICTLVTFRLRWIRTPILILRPDNDVFATLTASFGAPPTTPAAIGDGRIVCGMCAGIFDGKGSLFAHWEACSVVHGLDPSVAWSQHEFHEGAMLSRCVHMFF
jgi:hypothetical protein